MSESVFVLIPVGVYHHPDPEAINPIRISYRGRPEF